MEDDFCVLSGSQVKKNISVLVLKMVRFYTLKDWMWYGRREIGSGRWWQKKSSVDSV